jgi:signal transduction histidine kinase
MTLVTRVSAFFLATLAVVFVGFSLTLYFLARTHLQRDLDERLMSALDALYMAADVDGGRVVWRPASPDAAAEVHSDEDPVSWTVYDAHDRVLAHCCGAQRNQLPLVTGSVPDAGHVHLTVSAPGGPRWRLAARRLRAEPRASNDEPADSALTLVTGVPLDDFETDLRHAALTLAGLSLGLWMVAATGGRFLCRRALRPLCRMATAAGQLTAADPNPRLPSPGTGDELESLARAFNGLLNRLREALERQGRFAGDASHQLRTPLTALIGELEVAQRRPRTSDDYQAIIARAHSDAVRLSQTVEALLFLARADAQARLPDLLPIDLAAWISRHAEGWRSHERAGDIKLAATSGEAVPALVQPALLAQMLDNLIDNACKYSAAGTPITVGVARSDDTAVLFVEDRGRGVCSSDLPHLFDPFFRAEDARLSGAPGVGLGLAVVQRIVAAFGGRIDVDSERGRGSRFAVHIPLLGVDASRDVPEPGCASALRGGAVSQKPQRVAHSEA